MSRCFLPPCSEILSSAEKALAIFRVLLYNALSNIFAGVLELADEADSKSVASDGVRVRPPPPAP